MQIFSVFGRIGLEDREFNQSIDRADGRGRSFSATLGKTLAKGAAAGAAALLGVGVAALRVGGQFEGMGNNIQAQMGISNEALRSMELHARNVALQGNQTATDVFGAMEKIAHSSMDAEENIARVDHAMVLAEATGNKLGASAYFLSEYLEKVGKDSSYAGQLVNLFSASMNRTNMSLANMQNYIFRMTPAFEQMGASMETNIGIMQTLYGVGIRGAALYTGMSSIMTDFAIAGDFASAAAERFGVSMYDANGNMRAAEDIMFDTAIAMRDYSDQIEVASFYTDKLNIGQQQAWFEFMRNAEVIRDEVIPSLYAAGDASIYAEQRTAGFAQGLNVMRAAANDALLSIFEIIQAPVGEALRRGGEQASAFAMSLREGGEMRPQLERLGEAIAQMVEGLTNFAVRALPVVTNALSGFAGVLSTATNIASTMIGVIDRFSTQLMILGGAFVAYKLAVKASNALDKTRSKIVKSINLDLKAQTIATGKATVATGLKTKAQLALNKAFKANPIGMVIGGMALLGTALSGLASWLDRTTDSQRAFREESERIIESTRDMYKAIRDGAEARQENAQSITTTAEAQTVLLDQLERLKASEAELYAQGQDTVAIRGQIQATVEGLNKAIDGLNLTYDMENNALNMSTDLIRQNIDARMQQARATVYAEQMVEIARQQIYAEQQLAEAQSRRYIYEVKLANAQGESMLVQTRYQALLDGTIDNINDLTRGMTDLSGELEDVATRHADATQASNAHKNATRDFNDITREQARVVSNTMSSIDMMTRALQEQNETGELTAMAKNRLIESGHAHVLILDEETQQWRICADAINDYARATLNAQIIQAQSNRESIIDGIAGEGVAAGIAAGQVNDLALAHINYQLAQNEGYNANRATIANLERLRDSIGQTTNAQNRNTTATRAGTGATQQRVNVEREALQAIQRYISDRVHFETISTEEIKKIWEASVDKFKEGTDERREAERALHTARRNYAMEQARYEAELIADREREERRVFEATQATARQQIGIMEQMKALEQGWANAVENRANVIHQSAMRSMDWNRLLVDSEQTRADVVLGLREQEANLAQRIAEMRQAQVEGEEIDQARLTALVAEHSDKREAIREAEAKAQLSNAQLIIASFEETIANMERHANYMEFLMSDTDISKEMLRELGLLESGAVDQLSVLANSTQEELTKIAQLYAQMQEKATNLALDELQGMRHEVNSELEELADELIRLAESEYPAIGETMANYIARGFDENAWRITDSVSNAIRNAMDMANSFMGSFSAPASFMGYAPTTSFQQPAMAFGGYSAPYMSASSPQSNLTKDVFFSGINALSKAVGGALSGGSYSGQGDLVINIDSQELARVSMPAYRQEGYRLGYNN